MSVKQAKITENITTLHNNNNLRTIPPVLSYQNDCMQVFFDEMEFLPWDNPDNLVSSEVEATVRQVQATIFMASYLIGGPANVINMAVFYKQGLQDRVNLCLFALSLTDGLYLFSALLLHGEQVHLPYTSQETYGAIAKFLINHNLRFLIGFGFISPILSAIIATERCLCVLNPLKFQGMLRARTMGIIIAVVYVVVLGLFMIVVTRYRIGCLYDPVSNVVVTQFVKGEFYKTHKKVIDYIDSVFFGVGMPGFVMSVVMTTTLVTIVRLRQLAKWRSDTTSSSASASISAREVGLTKMLVGTSILFIICYTPEALNHVSRIFLPGMSSGGRYHNFYLVALWTGDIFIFFNASFNVFIYYSMGSRYRVTFWALWGRKPKPDRGVRSTAGWSSDRKSSQM